MVYIYVCPKNWAKPSARKDEWIGLLMHNSCLRAALSDPWYTVISLVGLLSRVCRPSRKKKGKIRISYSAWPRLCSAYYQLVVTVLITFIITTILKAVVMMRLSVCQCNDNSLILHNYMLSCRKRKYWWRVVPETFPVKKFSPVTLSQLFTKLKKTILMNKKGVIIDTNYSP